MVRPGRERLHGRVEVDETYVGGSESGSKRGRGSEKKQIVVIAVEIHSPMGFGRIRMRRITDVKGVSLVPFVCDVVEQGSEILTDGWSGYNGLSDYEYTHKKTVLSSSGNPAHVSMPGVHQVASLLKRWILGTHQGSIVPAHLHSEMIAELRIAQAGLALLQHKQTNNTFPATLDTLELQNINNPFSKELLRYKTQGQGFVLYSVGLDLKDNGGSPREKKQEKDWDIVWSYTSGG